MSANSARPQATRVTPKQLAYLSFWQEKGRHFAWNEEAPEFTVAPSHPVDKQHHWIRFAIGVLVSVCIAGLYVTY